MTLRLLPPLDIAEANSVANSVDNRWTTARRWKSVDAAARASYSSRCSRDSGSRATKDTEAAAAAASRTPATLPRCGPESQGSGPFTPSVRGETAGGMP